jgi:hypothetical protein
MNVLGSKSLQKGPLRSVSSQIQMQIRAPVVSHSEDRRKSAPAPQPAAAIAQLPSLPAAAPPSLEPLFDAILEFA